MKMSDILRSMADSMDQEESGGSPNRPENMGKSADDFQHDVTDGAESGDQDTELTGVMIPPLQQKLEILKKSAGMDNAYDQESDELGDIKKLTGIKAVIGHIAGEDNDIVG
jgi:hypothetical protein